MPESNGPTSPTSLNGRVAVVTGAASGLGLASAKMLSEHGARVVLIDRQPADVSAFGPDAGVSSHVADIADEAGIERIFERIAEEAGPVSILVNSAGVPTPGSVVQRGQAMALAEFRQVIDINLLGTINAIRCAVPQMINRRPGLAPGEEAGVVINVSSIAAYDGQIGSAAYSASKGGVAGMVLPLARELGEYGIRVLGIAPGIFETPMTTNLPEKHRDILLSSVPPFPRRPGQPHEFAMLVLSMIANPMLNGEVIRLDGGLRLPARV